MRVQQENFDYTLLEGGNQGQKPVWRVAQIRALSCLRSREARGIWWLHGIRSVAAVAVARSPNKNFIALYLEERVVAQGDRVRGLPAFFILHHSEFITRFVAPF